MQTRKAPPRAGSLAEATAAEARGQGRRKPTQGAAPASVFQGGPMGPMADLGMARGVRQVDPALPALSNNLLKSAQLPSASPRLKLKHQGQPDAFGDVSTHLLTWMRICLDKWANVLSTGAREAAWGSL